MARVAFLVDGFNLYHSACDASDALSLAGRGTKWLDIRAMVRSYAHLVGERDPQAMAIHYFTALAHFLAGRKPGIITRHQAYIDALKATGISVVVSRGMRRRRLMLRSRRSCLDCSCATRQTGS